MFVLNVCISISALLMIVYTDLFRFHIYLLIYNICFSLTYFTLYESLGPPTSLQMTQFHSFLCLILLFHCIYVNPSLSIHPASSSLLDVHSFVLYVCVSISAALGM